MVTIEDVRSVALSLPRAYEAFVRGRVKFRVGRIVFLAFSRDETELGFGFPKEWRDALVDSEPDMFRLPDQSDLRYNWAVVRMAAIDFPEMRELVIDAWAMCVPNSVAAAYAELDPPGMTILDLDTPHGPARAHLHTAEAARAALILGHGAGGGVAARDLVTASEVAGGEGFTVVLVEQPYRVAGRRSPAPARQLDAAWTAVVDHLLAGELRGLPLVVGGRSMGARVACRTAAATGAVGVLCLAFPLRPPRRAGAEPAPSRLAELDAVTVPTLVVQGVRDPFGMPPAGGQRTVVQVEGDHSLRTDLAAVAAAVRAWLPSVV